MNTRTANGRDDHADGLTFADLAATVATGRELHHLERVLRDELARGRVVQDGGRYRANLAAFDPSVLAALRGLDDLNGDATAAARNGHDRDRPRWSAGAAAIEQATDRGD